jgi:hypothetical protein
MRLVSKSSVVHQTSCQQMLLSWPFGPQYKYVVAPGGSTTCWGSTCSTCCTTGS